MRLPEPGIGQSNFKKKKKLKKLHENATIGFPERRYRYGTQAP